jgi:hypothetical protein
MGYKTVLDIKAKKKKTVDDNIDMTSLQQVTAVVATIGHFLARRTPVDKLPGRRLIFLAAVQKTVIFDITFCWLRKLSVPKAQRPLVAKR